jgi:hypothetical protein
MSQYGNELAAVRVRIPIFTFKSFPVLGFCTLEQTARGMKLLCFPTMLILPAQQPHGTNTVVQEEVGAHIGTSMIEIMYHMTLELINGIIIGRTLWLY